MQIRDEVRLPVQAAVAALSWEERIQLALDVVGLIPVLNVPTQLVSGLISLRRRDYVGFGLSLAGLVPFEGEAVVALKLARRARHLGHSAQLGARLARVAAKADSAARRPSRPARGARREGRPAVGAQRTGRERQSGPVSGRPGVSTPPASGRRRPVS
jgi:hypothetical protein